MDSPVVSVIMPAFNAEKYIGESIRSVISQTFQLWELIVVDDGSTDGTADIVRSLSSTDARIKYFFQENSRQGKAKNLGFKQSQGEYIAFLDADDLWMNEKLEVSLRELSQKNCSLLFTDCYIFEGETPDNFQGCSTMGVGEELFAGRHAVVLFLECNRVPNLTVVVKRNVLENAGQFSDRPVAEEYEMWLRMLLQGAIFKSISAPLSAYRLHCASVTADDRHATIEVINIIKDFGRTASGFRLECTRIARGKIKYWLYHGNNRTPGKFRHLVRGLFPFHLTALFCGMSFFLPIDFLRKFVIRLY